ncbi:unnamed protein product [Durusdinium trenchii]|uniref:Uncharacterized protein n=1 Tax=Durusdinium trenchii TaxID=1381693 RepID=A0ABP0SYV1_9DINO
MSYETADSQKEEFRKYLEKNGIISQLTRVLVGLYEEPERPANAIDYIKKYLGAPTGVDVEETARSQFTESCQVVQHPAFGSGFCNESLGANMSFFCFEVWLRYT